MFESYVQLLDHVQPVGIHGEVDGVCGLTVSVADFPAPIGAGCRIRHEHRRIEARVIGFSGDHTLVMPLGAMTGIARGDRVSHTNAEPMVAVGADLLGRVLDGHGRAIDGGPPVTAERRVPIWPEPVDPMQRPRIGEPLPTGVRVIDAMLTIGRGQRMGIFAGSGVGKSVLLGMIARYTAADVVVIGRIGERGRELREFLERDLGPAGRERCVVVMSTSDESPLVRIQAAAVATAIAEGFRDAGADVLLLVDSLTRLATAQREIGLAAGEPPATKGFPPSVFALLPQFVERAGRTQSGSITAFYTVLVEGDDPSEPISDAVRAVTDGHIVLSRESANRGHYPAVDCLRSVSRAMVDVTDAEHQQAARELLAVLATYSEIEDMVRVGAYRSGEDARRDRAVEAIGAIERFLAQPIDVSSSFDQTRRRLLELRKGVTAGEVGEAGPAAAGAPARPGRRSSGRARRNREAGA